MKRIFYILTISLLSIVLSFSAHALEREDSDLYTPEHLKIETEAREPLTLSPVNNLTAKSTRNSFSLSWEPLSDAYAYKIFVSTNGKKFKYLLTTQAAEKTLDKINRKHTYSYKVVAFTYDRGKAVFSPESTTATLLTLPETVTSITTKTISLNSISLTWDKAEDATHYQLWVYSKAKDKYLKKKTVTGTGATLTNLKENTAYKIKIRSLRKQSSGIAYGDFSEVYTEKTHKQGSPTTKAQTARYYNDLINALKKQTDFTVSYHKSAQTEFLYCSRKSLEQTIKNTLGLFNGELNKNYTFVGGTAENKTPMRLLEPYKKNAALQKKDIKNYSCKTDSKGVTTLKIILKGGEGQYIQKEKNNANRFKDIISVPEIHRLKTTPITVKTYDIYYDDVNITLKLKESRVFNLSYNIGALLSVNFRISSVSADTVIAYTMKESYKFK